MPTTNPRLTITLTPAVAAVLRELSGLAGNSQSAIVGELLETSLPVFERVVQAMRAAVTIRDSAKAEIADGLERAQAKLEAQLPLVMGHMDAAFLPLLEEAEKVTRRGPRATEARAARTGARGHLRGGSTPVALTGGSGSTKKVHTGGRKGGRGGGV
jgi:hypothetical protein